MCLNAQKGVGAHLDDGAMVAWWPIIVPKDGKSNTVWSLVHVDDAASAFATAAEAA